MARALGVYRGIVTKIDGDGRPFVEVPHLASGYEYGPLDVLEGLYHIDGIQTSAVADHRHHIPGDGDTDLAGGHDHDTADAVDALEAGNRVLVAFIDGDQDDPIVLGRIGA